LPFEDFPRRHGGAGVLIAEGDAMMDEIANGLDPAPSPARALEELPRHFRKSVGLAIAAAKQVDQRVRRQVFDRMLTGGSKHRVGLSAVAHDAIGRQTHRTGRRNWAGTMMSDARAKCVPNTMITGVGWGNS
jgi:hypothetical protein